MAAVPSNVIAPSRLQALARLPLQQLIGLVLAVGLTATLLVGAWTWSSTPDYRVLYANLSDRDGGAIIAALQQMNVPYKFTEGGGAILVPAGQVHDARLKLASQGLPKGGLVGFELMENQKLGMSQFQEQVNYQRALEGELARSVQSISAVQAARVHLAIPRQSVFLREKQKPSASVIVNLSPGRGLDPAQVSAIVHLVSSSVPELAPKSITVIDQSGALLSSSAAQDGPAAGLDPGQLKYRQQLENLYARRIEAILAPIVGESNLRAQVSADIDFSLSEQTAESYKPNGTASDAAMRSQHSTESVSDAGSGPSGIPGALSNQPPANASAPVDRAPGAGKPAAAAAAAAVSTRKESTVNYEVDKTVTVVRQATGGVRRLSAAVVVNYRAATDAKGKTELKPLSAEELAQITNLVKEAIGFDEKRGDSVNLVNSPFTVPPVQSAPETPLWKQPETINLVKDTGKHLLIAALALYLIFGVLRPLFRNLLAQPSRGQLLAVENSTHALPGEGAQRLPAQTGLEAARQLARQDPKVVANVVKSWAGGDER